MTKAPDDAAIWIAYAEDDLEAARRLLAPPRAIPHAVCFHAQQAVEKLLKAFLIHRKAAYPRSHDLDYLHRLCLRLDPEFGQVRQLCEELNTFGSPVRYPPDESALVNEQQAERAIALASQVGAFVTPRIDPHR